MLPTSVQARQVDVLRSSTCKVGAPTRCRKLQVTGCYHRAGGDASEPSSSARSDDFFRTAVTRVTTSVVSSLAAAVLATAPAAAETHTLRLPVSENPEIFSQQATLVEAWSVVNDLFYKLPPNWDEELEKHMRASFYAETKEQAYSEISEMLDELDDPYTRIVPPEQYAEFRVGSEGQLHGVGMLLASDPETKRLVVLAPLKNSPAERAGVKSGDVLVAINGVNTDGLDRENAARLLRGKKGTSVQVQVSRVTEQIPGVAGRPESPVNLRPVLKNVTMRRDTVSLSPVYATKITWQGKQLGYIRLASFSNNASRAVKTAMLDLSSAGATGFVLDLRNNPGGLVSSGMDVARLWLNGDVTVFNVAGRDDDFVQHVQLDAGRAASDDPLVVLVNGNSASASEILAGALRDYERATIIGDSPTYGKGKIQNLYELHDGSALFVTVATYQTPKMAEIDHVGVSPDVKCNLPDPAEELRALQLYGPMTVEEQLATDPCFTVAKNTLVQQMEQHPGPRGLPYTGPLKFMSATTVIRHR